MADPWANLSPDEETPSATPPAGPPAPDVPTPAPWANLSPDAEPPGAPDAGSIGNTVSNYFLDVLHGRVAAHTLENMFGKDNYDPNASFAANATNPDALNQATGVALAFNPANIASVTAPAPSARALADKATDQYTGVRNSGLEIDAAPNIDNLVSGLRSDFKSSGLLPPLAPLTHSILDEFGDTQNGAYTQSPGVYTMAGLDAARQRLNDLTLSGGNEGEAARRARNAIDDFTANLKQSQLTPTSTGDPQQVSQMLTDARANWAAAQRSNALTGELNTANTGILDRSLARAETPNASDLGNQISSRLTTFLQSQKNVAGYTPDQIDMLKQVAKGSLTQKGLQAVGSMFGPHGLGAGLGVGLMDALMEHGFDWKALGLAATPLVVGGAAKSAAGAMAARNLGAVDEVVRGASPLGRSMQASAPSTLPSWYGSAASNVPWRLPAGLLGLPTP